MTSSTLYREGDDLDALLAELSAEYGDRVRVVAVDQDRPAGVRGLFARRRVAVQYCLDDVADASQRPQTAPAARAAVAPTAAADPLAELIAAADEAEAAPARATANPAVAGTPAANAEFASMLLELAAAKAAERAQSGGSSTTVPGATIPGATVPPATVHAPATPAAHRPAPRPAPARRAARPIELPDLRAAEPAPSVQPRPEPYPVSRPDLDAAAAPPVTPAAAVPPVPAPPVTPPPVTPPPVTAPPVTPAAAWGRAPYGTGSDAALVLRRRLADIGVPMHLLPSTSTDPVAAVTVIASALPSAPQPPVGRGAVLAVVGPAAQLAATARRIGPELGVGPERIWAAGLPNDAIPGAIPLRDAWDAATAARLTRDRMDRLVIALVATDAESSSGRNRQPGRILGALQADAVWAVVDATRKPDDTRRRLAELGPVTAAVVVDAAETSSPATVLELGVPVALLDGEPASRQRWTAALLDALTEQEP